MEKYYTPKVEEFCVGFECEQVQHSFIGHQLDVSEPAKWNKCVIEPFHLTIALYPFPHDENGCTFYRVKYLDIEDIEELGFVKRAKDEWVGWHDYILKTISGDYGYFLKATLHVPRMKDTMYKIYVHRHLADTDQIEGSSNYDESKLVFEGEIKNKSELKRTLKQLGIWTEV